MEDNSVATKPAPGDQDSSGHAVKQLLNLAAPGSSSSLCCENLTELMARQLQHEERTMEKIGHPLPRVHLDEHKKLLEKITALEYRWKTNRISDDSFRKALTYKLEFHSHYFDEAQQGLIAENQY